MAVRSASRRNRKRYLIDDSQTVRLGQQHIKPPALSVFHEITTTLGLRVVNAGAGALTVAHRHGLIRSRCELPGRQVKVDCNRSSRASLPSEPSVSIRYFPSRRKKQ